MTAGSTGFLISVVLCTHHLDNYANLTVAIKSLLEQTHPDKEIVVVVDGNRPLYEKILRNWGKNPTIKVSLLTDNQGVCAARNAGITASEGEIIAFLDDDAFAEKSWLENLAQTYREHETVAVGGKILPVWVEKRPNYLPEELYWLVGATNAGFADNKVVEVRNAFGPNMSFKREVFHKVGLFDPRFGFSRNSQMQAEEPELALRIKHKMGKNVIYNPEAVVYHRVPPEKTRWPGLLKRCFYQGYSKAILSKYYPGGGAVASEQKYLRYLLSRSIPGMARRFYRLAELQKLALLSTSIISVGLGFGYGRLAGRTIRNNLWKIRTKT